MSKMKGSMSDSVFGSPVRRMRGDLLAVALGGPGENYMKDGGGPDNQSKGWKDLW